ncbi:hypothetical protein ACOBQB_10180 [Streptomyces sp. G5(2025)]|uniref:hypothetical protein n=1 Tax=Streptomyces sp. G5(2025) TaxID=3406628 RepID=UPI003C141F73
MVGAQSGQGAAQLVLIAFHERRQAAEGLGAELGLLEVQAEGHRAGGPGGAP